MHLHLAALALALHVPSAPQTPDLERALASIRSEEVSADIHFLAADELGGRDTPSQGLAIAARFIRARLQRLGFQPGGRDGFFHTYRLERRRLDLERSGAWLERGGERVELVFGEEYFTRGVEDLELSAPVVFAGTGSEADVAELDLDGRWAAVRDSDVPWRKRRDNARAGGAIGLIIVSRDADEGGSYQRRMEWMARRARTGSLGLAREEPAGGAPEAPFSLVFLARAPGGKLLGDAPALGDELGRFGEVRAVSEDTGAFEIENVCGLWPGSDPQLGREVILVSAHYDHVGTYGGEIYNGADDNGSGTSGLLALAEALASHGPLRRSVLLLWVSGEEKGLLGSKAWARDPTLPEGWRAVCDINIDMIGRNAADSLLVTPTRELEQYNGLTRLAESLAPLEGFPELGSCDEYWARSDQRSFSDHLGIPVCFLFADVHEDYHQPTDTADKIDCDKIRRVARLVLRMLDGLQEEELPGT